MPVMHLNILEVTPTFVHICLYICICPADGANVLYLQLLKMFSEIVQ